MARHYVLCRRRRSNRYSFGVFATVDAFKLLGQRRNITTQAAVPTLGVLSHELNPRAKVGSLGLPIALSTKSTILSKNSNAFNGGHFCKSTSHSNLLLMLRNYATNTEEEAEKHKLKLGRMIKQGAAAADFPQLLFTGNRNNHLIKYNAQQGDRAYFHTTRWLSSPLINRPPYIPIPIFPSVEKTKFELRLINAQGGFQIHYIMPVQTKGRRVVRLYNSDHHFVQDWLPYIETMVKSQPAELRALMDRYWLLPDKRKSHDTLLASLMLHYGVHNNLPIFDNYWDETVKIALPYLEEDRKQYLGKILEDFPRGGVYGGREFVKGLSRIARKEVSVEFEQHYSGDTEAVGVMLLLDEEKNLMDHPEHGTKCCRQFVF